MGRLRLLLLVAPVVVAYDQYIHFLVPPDSDVEYCALSWADEMRTDGAYVRPAQEYWLPIPEGQWYLRCRDQEGNVSLPANPGDPVLIERLPDATAVTCMRRRMAGVPEACP